MPFAPQNFFNKNRRGAGSVLYYILINSRKRSGRMNRTAVVQIPEDQLDRVATAFIKAASGFASQITITRDGHCINAKSLLGFLSLMRDHGEVELSAEGSDAGEALEALTGILGA